jgi:DNA-binding NarL/FixJ family response regulator
VLAINQAEVKMERLNSFSFFNPGEGQVAAVLMTGASNSEIAHELGMSLRTVKGHCSRLYRRFGLKVGKRKRVKFVTSMLHDQPTSTTVHLNPRQIRVCDLVVLGFTNKQIGERLGTTEFVIKNYLRGIFDATGVYSRLELAIFWKSHEVVVP